MLKRGKAPPITPKALSKDMAKVNGAGRVQLYAVQLSTDTTILIYNIYGWTNANHCKWAASRTNALIQAILSDMAMQPSGPMFVVGDLNGDPHNLCSPTSSTPSTHPP